MPFRYLSHAVEASSSRKRSHAEMARSESRSQSPQQPAVKRQRTSATPSTSSFAPSRRFRSPSVQSSSQPQLGYISRFAGDGLDFRRPMISAAIATHIPPEMIDLTADDSPPSEHQNALPQQQSYHINADSSFRSEISSNDQILRHRGPRFGRNIIAETSGIPEIIDLSSDDTEDQQGEEFMDPGIDVEAQVQFQDRVANSPEVQFLRERLAPSSGRNTSRSRTNARRLPTPPTMRPRTNQYPNLSELLRRGTNFLWGEEGGSAAAQEREDIFEREMLDRIDGIEQRPRGQPFGLLNLPDQHPTGIGMPEFVDLDELEELQMDYGNAAFRLLPQRNAFLEVVDPAADRSSTPPEVVKEPYKAPPACREGFTRNFEEDEYLECPSCHEELGVGDTEVKEQIWISKSCGHVYCGECTKGRFSSKRGRKGKGKAVQEDMPPPRMPPFKNCLVPDCGKKVNTPHAMFLIYL